METRQLLEDSDNYGNFAPNRQKSAKSKSVKLLTIVTIATLFTLGSARTEVLDDSSGSFKFEKPAVSYPIKITANNARSGGSAGPAPIAFNESDWRSYSVKHAGDLYSLAVSNGLNTDDIKSILALGGAAGHLNNLYYGDKLNINVSADNSIMALEYDVHDSKRLRIARLDIQDANPFVATVITRPLTIKSVRVQGSIEQSLYKDALGAGLSGEKTIELVRIFDYLIDYSKDIKKGDIFTVLYEQRFRGDERIEDGPILAAEFINNGKTLRAIRYAAPNDKARYYFPDGIGLHTTFLRNPVDYPLISSEFNPSRKHPTLHKIRAHKGVDYAADRGTPIKATGDGFVEFKGGKGGYGKTVIIHHSKEISTLYAHLDRYAKSLRAGDRIMQGDIIGYVGSTGRATGTHLHYEFHVNGKHVDPLQVYHPIFAVPENRKFDFFAKSQALLTQLQDVEQVKVAWGHSSKQASSLN